MRNWCRLQKSHTACRAFSVCCYIYFRRSTLLLQFVVCSRQACIMPQRVCVFANMPPAHHIKNSSLAPISASDWYAFWSARRIISQKTAASLWCRFFLSISCITCSLPVSTRRAHNKRTKTNKKMPKEKMFLTDCGVCAMNKFSKYACISVAPLNWTAIGQVWQAPFCPIVCCRSVFGVPWSQCDVCLCVCICVSVQCTGAFGRWRRRPTYTAISAAAVAAKCMYCMPNYTLVVVVVVASCTPQRFGPQAHSRFFFTSFPASFGVFHFLEARDGDDNNDNDGTRINTTTEQDSQHRTIRAEDTEWLCIYVCVWGNAVRLVEKCNHSG